MFNIETTAKRLEKKEMKKNKLKRKIVLNKMKNKNKKETFV